MADGKKAVMARQLDAAQAICHVGSWESNIEGTEALWSDETYRIYGLEPQSCAVTRELYLDRLHPDDRARVQALIESAILQGGGFSFRTRIVRPDGSVRVVASLGEVVTNDLGQPISLLGTIRDVTEEDALERERELATCVQTGERKTLELLAAGAPLGEVLAAIVDFIEEVTVGAIVSVLLLDGDKLRHGAAPHLPEDYNRAIDGVPIGPAAGSCGTAAYRGEPVFVEDITTDPLWIGYRHLAEPHGLRACWSVPILGSDGRVLGTFATYYREVKRPAGDERELIERAAHVASIAIERRQLDDQLRALNDRIEAAREDERTSIAREIHDELGQALTAIKLDLAWVAHRVKGLPDLSAKLDDMSRASDDLIQAVRRISSELRPGILDSISLQAAIEWQADEFTRRTGTPVDIRSQVGDLQLERELATTAFRIFQEALTNIARHASATRVDVVLRLERGHLRLEVSDDGIGVPEIAPRASSLGLLGMRERARRCGGDCIIRRRDPRGTVVSLTVPLRFPKEREEELA